ncbi:MAG: hypothetical protein U0931_38525 [Vulcanimicrobiota bacterium]
MLKNRRIEMGLSRARLARKTGVPVCIIQQLEDGAPTGRERELASLRAYLDIPAPTEGEPDDEDQRNLRGWLLAAPACASWNLPTPPSDFCQQVPCTVLQALAWGRLLKDGAIIGQISPVELGFWAHSLLDERHLPLGIQPLPYLSWDSKNWRFIIWPQVRIRCGGRAYRLDGLVLTAGWCQSQWAALHLDGEQSVWDEGLVENLNLPVLMADPQQVHDRSWRPRLETLLQPSTPANSLNGHTVQELLGQPISSAELERLARRLAS